MKTFNCNQCHIEVKQVKPLVIPHCPNCGSWMHMEEVIESKSTRKQALEWWDKLNQSKQPQVDFLMIEELIELLNKHKGRFDIEYDSMKRRDKDIRLELYEVKNLQLFFHLLSTKPTFAKIAHESLKKLKT